MHMPFSDPDLLRRWLEGNLREEEMAQIEANEEWKAWVDAAAQITPVPLRSKAAAWEALESRIQSKPLAPAADTARMRPLRKAGVFAAVAAAVALLFAVYLVLPEPDASLTLHTESAKQLTYQLPDGSSVILNAQSTLSFDPDTWDQSRAISLVGEAYFMVRPGSSFIVTTDRAEVRVLGTEFNVFARDARVDVACFTGKVEVATPAKRLILEPGAAARVDDTGTLQAYAFETGGKAAWKKGEFYFEKVPLKFVIEELERQFDVVVLMPSVTGRMYTGFFTNENLQEALDMVCLPMGLHYTFEDKTRIRLTE